jgi:DNA polymerase V
VSEGHGTIEHVFEEISQIRPVAQLTVLRPVPIATDLVPAGWPSPAQDYFDGDIDLSEHLIRNRAATFVVRVAGDSMIGAGISDGDELVVDRSLDPLDGDVVIAVIDGEMTVKRLRLTGTGPELHPENPAYPVLHPTELSIWGVVTTCLHHMRS